MSEADGGEPEPTPPPSPPPRWQGIVLALLVSGAAVYGLVALVLIQEVRSYDGFWHLATGRLIVETGAVPRADPFCFTTPDHGWVNLSWLAESIDWRLFARFGYSGPLTLASWLFVAAFLFTLLHMRARRVAPLLALVGLTAVSFGLLLTSGIRPRSFSAVFLAVFAWILAMPDADDRFTWPRAGAIALCLLLWDQLHGGFVYGYAILGLDAAGTTFSAWRRGDGAYTRRAALLSAAVAVGLGGFLLHPHGIDALLHPLFFVSQQKFNQLNPEFRGMRGRSWLSAVFALLLLAGAGLAIRPREARPRELLVLGLFLVMTIRIRRVLSPLLILAVPLLAERWTRVIEARAGPVWEGLQERLRPAVALLPAVLLLALVTWTAVVAPERTPPGEALETRALDPATHPVSAAKVLQRTPGRVFNLYRTGGLLDLVLGPHARVFIDGRQDLHSRSDTLERYLQVLGVKPGWEQVLDDAGVDLVLMNRGAPLLDALQERGWTVLHDDPAFRLLRRP